MITNKSLMALSVVLLSSVLTACFDGKSKTSSNNVSKPDTKFVLQFKAVSGEEEVNCDTLYSGFGPDQSISVGVTDLRFYVSNLKFYNADGDALDIELDDNEFQLNHEAGRVALVDFTGTSSGYCEQAAEGTPRTNTVLTGSVSDQPIAAISFDIGVPQTVMKAVIDDTDIETDSPSPLAEMYWSWASGYRHFVLNFSSMDSVHTDMVENSGFHIGSRGCGSAAGKALSDRDECDIVNTAEVMLTGFDPNTNVVTVDLQSLFANVKLSDFSAPAWTNFGDDDSICVDERRNGAWCVTGTNFGLQCHSGSTQGACQSLFPNFGLNLETGAANSITNIVFGKE